jgi:alkanesulfonate monooxygenase SsuD/methylene tetrahydromethanopterin reductase-like flavin-dependent oxidoreductase (luciferase family)
MELEFYMFSPDIYPYVPQNDVIGEVSRTTKVSLPTSFYEPTLARKTLDEFLEVARRAEALGFDGVLCSEQHGTPNGLCSSAMVGATAMAMVTSKIRIGAVGPILNAYLTPVRLAEEIALLDMLSNGRLFIGLPLGIGTNYHAYGVTDPTSARDRHREGLELLIKAMTEPGPFHWQGEYFNVPYVNLWNRPIQQPHPEIWVPAAGSQETLQLCADKRFVYQAVLNPGAALTRNIGRLKDLCREAGYEADPKQICAVIGVHVAETDEQARLEVEAHVRWLHQNYHRSTFADSFAPGHVSEGSLRNMMQGGYRSRDTGVLTWDELQAEGMVIAGSPDTVADRITEFVGGMGAGRLITVSPAVMGPWLRQKSMTLLAEEVMPRFRPPGGAPVWARPGAGYPKTSSELATQQTEPRARPTAMIDGTLVDVATSHLADPRVPSPLA